MDRNTAIEYLNRKGRIDSSRAHYTVDDEKKISEVMSSGKIYGDPLAEIQW